MQFSVLMSVYKKEKPEFLYLAIKSIWEDQILKPSEIVLVKDGPLGNDLNNCIDIWKTKLNNKLKVITLTANVGLASALSEGLRHCEYDIIARMDSDDISLPERFQKQVTFMINNPDIAVSSAVIEEFDETGKTLALRKLPLEHDNILRFAKNRSPVSHPVVIFKKSEILAVGGYPNFRNEDTALWTLLLVKGCKFANLPDVLLRMRTDNNFLKRRGYEFLKGEYSLLKFQKKVGFISLTQYLKNIVVRSTVRLSPKFVKKLLYKYARG